LSLPKVNQSIGHLKIAFMWGFYYLKNEYTYEDAIKDILMRGGDTDTNAAIIGGLLGAAYGIECLKEEWCETMLNYKGPI
jgi:ADP-ribosyl-[dinitrogen reductase] hydrolase